MSRVLAVAALRWTDPRASVDPLTGTVRTDTRGSGAGAADLCALAHALRLARAVDGRCLAVTVGPPAADGMLREALAAGAHEVLRVEGPDEDGDATARSLHLALAERHGRPDVVVCGDHSADRGTGSTPAHLAARFGAAQALGLLELDFLGGELLALRRLDGGRRERLAVPLPAVCSVEPTAVRPPRAALPALLASRTAGIPVVTVEAPVAPRRVRASAPRPYRPRARIIPVPGDPDPRRRLLALTGALVERTPPRVITPESPAAAARELLEYLREHGYPVERP